MQLSVRVKQPKNATLTFQVHTGADICPKHKELFIQRELTANSWKLIISPTWGQKHGVNVFNQLKGNRRANTSPSYLTQKASQHRLKITVSARGLGGFFVLFADTITLGKKKNPTRKETNQDAAFPYLMCQFFKILYKTEILWGEKQALIRPH